eukprot:Nk52_evm17s229 gene=Nk52_evmTU17s229
MEEMDITETPPSRSMENLTGVSSNGGSVGYNGHPALDSVQGGGAGVGLDALVAGNGEEVEEDEEENDLAVEVSNPEKQGDGFRSYVAYEINAKTSLPCYKSYQMNVKRRYNEFSWLYNNLVANYPGIVIPPIPDKKLMGKFQEKLLEERCNGFNMFLKRVARHPVLKTSPELVKFLDPDQHIEKSEFKKIESREDGNLSLQEHISKVMDSYSKLSISQSKMETFIGEKIKHFNNMEMNLKALLKKLEAVSESRQGLSESTKLFAESMNAFGEKEPYEDLSKRLIEYSDVERKVAELENCQVKTEMDSFANVLREHINMIGAIKTVFDKKNAMVKEVNNAELNINRKADAEYKARVAGKPDKIQAAEEATAQAKETAERLKTQLSEMSVCLRSEIERFEIEEVKELDGCVISFITALVEHQRKVVALWDDYIGMR